MLIKILDEGFTLFKTTPNLQGQVAPKLHDLSK